MGAPFFISRKLRFKGKVSVWATAISSFVMIVAVSISSGYRAEIRSAVADVCADATLHSEDGVLLDSCLLSELERIDGIASVTPVILEPGVIKSGEIMEGVAFKGVPSDDEPLTIRIPERLSRILGKGEGDRITAYFFAGKVKARNFTIREVYPSPVELDRNFLVYCPIGDLRRVLGMPQDMAGNVEIRLDGRYEGREAINEKAAEIGFATGLRCESGARQYASLFDWLQVIDINVAAILVLMALVAAFNMISGLLIMIMRSTATIGTLKAMGMDNSHIARTFLAVTSRSTAAGLLAGNVAALLLLIVQDATHFLKLDPSFYFVSYVPVKLNFGAILATDLGAWAVIMLLMLLPSMLISRIDPAQSITGQLSTSPRQ